MITTEVIEQSPMRALEKAIRGGLGAGRVGLVAARSGVGKTACLVQIGLDALMRGKTVLHVSAEAPVDRLRAYYDELLREMERLTALELKSSTMIDLERRRLLVSQPGDTIEPDRVQQASTVAQGVLGRSPEVLIVEGVDWSKENPERAEAWRSLASDIGAELWMSARTHRHVPVSHPRGIPSPVDKHEQAVDVVLALEPQDSRVLLRVLKGRDEQADAKAGELLLDAVTMMLVGTDSDMARLQTLRRQKFLLHTGGARGTEATFGETAERYGIREVTLSFEGHPDRVRSRGLRLLDDDELRLGDVSLRYVSHHLHRSFPKKDTFRKVLQSIWHQVRPCEQVFVVGVIQDDGTVRGGTGWGAELARRWNKELFVFDQDQDKWFQWNGERWVEALPVIRSPQFCGTGTRHLRDNGKAAIEALFERSFSPSNG